MLSGDPQEKRNVINQGEFEHKSTKKKERKAGLMKKKTAEGERGSWEN